MAAHLLDDSEPGGASDAIRPLRSRLEALEVPVVIKPFPLDVLERHLNAALSAER
jgi:hypothetical protein